MTDELRVSSPESYGFPGDCRVVSPLLTMEQQSALFSAVFAHSSDGMAFIDHNSVILVANETFAQQVRVPLVQLVGRPVGEVIPAWSEQADSFCRGVRETAKTSPLEGCSFELMDQCGRGATDWIPTIWPICVADGTFQGWLLRHVQAAEHNSAETQREWRLEKAGESEASYRAIFDCANDAILVHDPETGEILDVNQKTGEMYGYTPEEFRHLKVEDISVGKPPYSQEQALQRIRKASDGEPQLFEWLAKDRSGRLFWVEVNLKRATIGSKGRLLAVVRDITERKWAEQALRKAHDELEIRVRDRTAELARVNEELRIEIYERKRTEEALKTERERLFSLLDRLPAFVYVQARDRSIRFANRRFQEIFGDPKGRSCYNIFHGREEPCEVCKAISVLDTKSPRQADDRPINGRIYQVYDYPFTDVDGSCLLLELGIDVTERKQAEEEREKLLKEVQQRVAELDTTLTSIADGLVIYGPNTGIVRMNPAAEKILGFQPGVRARPLSERMAVTGVESPDGKALPPEEAPASRALCGEAVQGEVLVLHPFPDRTIWVSASAAPLRGPDGTLLGAISTFTDITRVHELQEQLELLLKEAESQRQLFARVVDVAPVAILVLRGPDFVCEVVNPTVKELYPAEVTLGRPFAEVWPGLAELALPCFERALRTGKPERAVDLPVQIRRLPNGPLEEAYFTAGIVPMSPPGSAEQTLVIAAVETTEQVLASKRLRELDRQKTEFLSLVAHELRTPLTALKGYSQTAMRRLKASEGHEREIKALQIVEAQTDRMANLVSELLDISRIEQGRLELRVDNLDLGRLSKDVVHLLQVTTDRHHLRLSVDGVVEAVGDPSRIEQVLFNLIHNAIKYSPQGGVVEIDVGRQPGNAFVKVRDYGRGIAQDNQPYLFDRFYQAHTAGQAFGGLGIGLYISRKIVTGLGGEMWMESEEGKGSTFCFTLPLA